MQADRAVRGVILPLSQRTCPVASVIEGRVSVDYLASTGRSISSRPSALWTLPGRSAQVHSEQTWFGGYVAFWHKPDAPCLRFLGLQSAGKRTLSPPKVSANRRCCVPQYPPNGRRSATGRQLNLPLGCSARAQGRRGLAQDPGRGSLLFLLRKAQPTTLPRYFPYIESYVPLTYRVGCCTFYLAF